MCEDEEISGLKQTVRTQQKLLHELYVELEAEREASATAATEALSMILRLQREKAADKLEAIQFKRITQEDLNHAHQIILLFQDTLRHKDMFIASLDSQLQAYHHQMLSMGLTHSQIQEIGQGQDHEFQLYANDLNNLFEESAPTCCEHQTEHLDTSLLPEVMKEETIEFDPHSPAFSFPDPAARGLNAIELDLPCSSYQPNDPQNPLQIDHTNLPCLTSSSQFTTIHDVFEVPQQNNHNQKDQGEIPVLERDNMLQNPDPMPHGTTTYCCRDENGWPLKSASDEIKPTKSGQGVSVNCHVALVDLANGIFPFQTDLKRLETRLEKLEGERIWKQGVSGNEEEELRLLREIHEKLSTIQSQVTSGRAKHPVVDEPSLISLMENLFFYSL